MENIIAEKINKYSSKFIKDIEKMMDQSTKKAQMKIEKGDMKLFKEISENDVELEKMKSSYHNKN